jgi:hypothetical protein
MIAAIGKNLKPGLDLRGDTKSFAIFSSDLRHRYLLYRNLYGEEWPKGRPLAVFIGQNPSKAGAVENDMTITKEMGFARRLGFGHMAMVNLASRIATAPADLLADPDHTGPYNETMIRGMWLSTETMAGSVRIAAWGAFPHFLREILRPSLEMVKGLGDLLCLGKTSGGSPRHASRLGYSAKLEPWP